MLLIDGYYWLDVVNKFVRVCLAMVPFIMQTSNKQIGGR